MRRQLAVLVVAAATSMAAVGVQPASANPGTELYTGAACAFTAGTNLLFDDPDHDSTVMTGGPMSVIPTDPANTIYDVTITCTIVGDRSVSRTLPGNTSVLAEWVSFVPASTVHLCTTVEWNSTKGHTVIYEDVDGNPANGVQCAEYTFTG